MRNTTICVLNGWEYARKLFLMFEHSKCDCHSVYIYRGSILAKMSSPWYWVIVTNIAVADITEILLTPQLNDLITF